MKKWHSYIVIAMLIVSSANAATMPERIIGYRSGSPSLWFPYLRDLSNWNMGMDNPQQSTFGWSGATVTTHLADINGDGLDDKVLVQVAAASPTHQFIWVATTEDNFSDITWANPSTDREWWNSGFDVIFGDIDGDGIDDNNATASGTEAGGGATELRWATFLSENITGISYNHGGLSNFVSWNTFGVHGTDVPYMGDFNGDGIDDRVIYNPTTFQVAVDYSSIGSYGNSVADVTTTVGGVAGDQLAVSDINGDGIDDLVIIRANTTGGNDYYDIYGWYTSGGALGSGVADIQSIAGVASLNDQIKFGQIDPGLDGDYDKDGDVDIDDLRILALNWLNGNDYVEFAILAGNWLVGTPNIYYISSSTGNDSNDGLSEATPWQSFNNVNALTLQAGEKVLLKRDDTWTQELRLAGVGTPTKKIELGAYGTGDKPIISRLNDQTDFACVIEEGSYWNINNLDLRNAKLGLYLRYIYTNNNRDMTISDCHFQDITYTDFDPANYGNEVAWSCGIWIGGQVNSNDNFQITNPVLDGLTVQGCTFQDCVTGISNNWYHLPLLGYRSLLTNFLIEDCQQWGFSLNGIIALNHASNGTMQRLRVLDGGGGAASSGTTAAFLQFCEDLTIDNCEFSYFDRVDSADGTGFDFEGDCHNIMFTNNIIHNNDGAAILWLSSQVPNSNITMQDCVFFNNSLDANGSPGDNDYELKSAGGQDGTGTVTNCGIYRSATSSGWFSSKWDNVTKIGNRHDYYSNVSGRQITWEFNSSGNLEGWAGFNQWSDNSVSGGVLNGNSSGADPYAYSSDTWVNSHDYPYVRINMSQTAGATAQLFFIRETDTTWDADKSVSFNITADGNMHEYIIDLRDSADFKGIVTKFRLDPTDASGSTIEIDYLRASSN